MHKQIDIKKVPGDSAWGNLNADIELPYAYKNFGGKSKNEVLLKFSDNVIERSSELCVMPNAVFPYYMLAFSEFVVSGYYLVADAGDVFSCFFNTIDDRLSKSVESISCIAEDLEPTSRWIADVQDAFLINREIYGDFSEKKINIWKMMDLTELKNGHEHGFNN